MSLTARSTHARPLGWAEGPSGEWGHTARAVFYSGRSVAHFILIDRGGDRTFLGLANWIEREHLAFVVRNLQACKERGKAGRPAGDGPCAVLLEKCGARCREANESLKE